METTTRAAIFILVALTASAFSPIHGGSQCQVIYNDDACTACLDQGTVFARSTCHFICQWDADRNGEITNDEFDALINQLGGVAFPRVQFESMIRTTTGLCDDQVKEFASRMMDLGPDNPDEFGPDDMSAFYAAIVDEAAIHSMAMGPVIPDEFGPDDMSAFYAAIADKALSPLGPDNPDEFGPDDMSAPVPCQMDFMDNYRQFWVSIVNDVKCA